MGVNLKAQGEGRPVSVWAAKGAKQMAIAGGYLPYAHGTSVNPGRTVAVLQAIHHVPLYGIQGTQRWGFCFKTPILSLLPITQTVLCSFVHPICCHLPCNFRLCEDSVRKVTVDHFGLSRQFWIPSYPRVILDQSSLIHSFILSCIQPF